ncbi:MAG: hypothetical protein WCO78_02515 [Candidatus Roizmanbacteria bacterium]
MQALKSSHTEDYSFLLGILAFIFIILGLFFWQTRIKSSNKYITGGQVQVVAKEAVPKKTVEIRMSNASGLSSREISVPKNAQLILRFSRSPEEEQGVFFPAHDEKSFQFMVGETVHTVIFEPFQQTGTHDFLASVYTDNLSVFQSMKGVITVSE